jgi:hypothetical protein
MGPGARSERDVDKDREKTLGTQAEARHAALTRLMDDMMEAVKRHLSIVTEVLIEFDAHCQGVEATNGTLYQ